MEVVPRDEEFVARARANPVEQEGFEPRYPPPHGRCGSLDRLRGLFIGLPGREAEEDFPVDRRQPRIHTTPQLRKDSFRSAFKHVAPPRTLGVS